METGNPKNESLLVANIGKEMHQPCDNPKRFIQYRELQGKKRKY
jgi:hypothetical protein